MSKRTILQIVAVVAFTLLMLVGCGSSDDDLIIGKWEAEDGLIMEFREFNDEDDPEWRTLSGNEQSGIVILYYPSEGPAAQMGTYYLAEGGKILNLSLRTNIDLSQPGPGISIGVMTYLYALDEVTKDKLVIHHRMSGNVSELQRVTESQ